MELPLVVSLVFLAVMVGVFFYLRTFKASREHEIRHIQNRLVEKSRLREMEEAELVPVSARARDRQHG